MIELRPYQSMVVQALQSHRAVTHHGHRLAAVSMGSPTGHVCRLSSRSANTRKGETCAVGFYFGQCMPKKPFVGPLPKCCIDDCNRIVESITGKMCAMHSMRVHRYGDPHYLTPESVRRANNRAAQMASRPSVKGAYAKLHGRHEHRVVAEQIIGRPLMRREVVHHIDGNRRNNDPSNLKVMTQADHLREHFQEMMQARKEKHGY